MLMDTVKKKLGYMVRSERERRGLSQSRLAEQAGVSTRTISDIETCNGNPELATLIPSISLGTNFRFEEIRRK